MPQPTPAQTDDALTQDLLELIDASPTPYHAVAEAARRLQNAGFSELEEGERWALAPGGRHYVVRGGSSVAAFVVGDGAPQDTGFALIGAHTDSPNLRVKPHPDLERYGYRQLAVEVYGGVLLSTWLDRDLSMSGRVVVDDGSPWGSTHLVRFERPVARIPNLAIHLNRNVNLEGLLLNPQRHLTPIWALEGHAVPNLADALCSELAHAGVKVEPEGILGFDLCLHDTQPSARGGHASELIFAPRLDNLASCHAALHALSHAPARSDVTRGIVLYDHEEVGSRSAQGAASSFVPDLLGRLCAAVGGGEPDALPRAVSRSLLISADMAHAVHPNYADKHEPGHRPVLGRGPVVKTNVAQAYASDAQTRARFAQLCRRADVTPQHFVSRNDLACGSTIGPITAGRVGVPTVDVGNPLLSMHSVREMAAVADVGAMQRVLDAFFA